MTYRLLDVLYKASPLRTFTRTSVVPFVSKRLLSADERRLETLLPEYQPRMGEEMEVKRARLLYQSRKRGMLENGLVLSSFADKHLSTFSSNQLDQYDHIINTPSNDWQLYYWITGREETPTDYDNEVMDLIKKHTRNGDLGAS